MDATEPPPPERIVLIDLVRGLSIGLVLAVHLGLARFAQGLDKPVPEWWNLLARNGGYGVSLFFVISGFLITRILMSSQPDFVSIQRRAFYARRAGRILPLLGLTLIIGTLFLCAPLARTPKLLFCFHLPKSLNALWAAVATFTFNWLDVWYDYHRIGIGRHWAVLWSISVEEQFYFFYPLLLLRLRRLPRVVAALLLIVLLGPCYRWWAFRIDPQGYLLSLGGSFGAFDQIAIGCLLFFISRRTGPWLRNHARAALALATAGIAALVLTYLRFNIHSGLDRIWGPSFMAGSLLLFLWGGLAFDLKHTVISKFVCLPGELSYGIYLLHGTVLYLCWDHVRQADPWIAFGLFLVANIALAQLSFRFFERPANLWMRRQALRLFERLLG